MAKLRTKQGHKIYDILENIGGASKGERNSFIYAHCESDYICEEWRFQGKLGFGGKYRIERNMVDYYLEDETPEMIELTKEINKQLSEII